MKIIQENYGQYWAARGEGYVFDINNAHHYSDEEAWSIVKDKSWLKLLEVPQPKYEDQPGVITGGISSTKLGQFCEIEQPPRLREYTSAERKAMPVDAGDLKYFPDAHAATARVSVKGNEKHNPGEPLHWSRGKSNDHLECVVRHLLTPYEIDPESGEPHINHALWRLKAAVQINEEKRLIALGIKPLSGVVK